jgi:hypothetical protein
MKGLSYGGGLEISAACDIRVASSDTSFAMPEVKLGIIPGYGGTQRLRKLIGLGHSLAFILGAQEIDAETARIWGLVDLVTSTGQAEATALELASRVASFGPLALAAAKRAIRGGAEMPLADGLALERASFIECAASSDFDEGSSAFLEKRAPHFHGVYSWSSTSMHAQRPSPVTLCVAERERRPIKVGVEDAKGATARALASSASEEVPHACHVPASHRCAVVRRSLQRNR